MCQSRSYARICSVVHQICNPLALLITKLDYYIGRLPNICTSCSRAAAPHSLQHEGRMDSATVSDLSIPRIVECMASLPAAGPPEPVRPLSLLASLRYAWGP